MRMTGMLLLLLCFAAAIGNAKPPQSAGSLPEALEQAKKEGKMLFVEFGRKADPDSQSLKELIQKGKLKIPEAKYVYVGLNCDDMDVNRAFFELFNVAGNMLPLVVITDSDGKQVESRSGYGDKKAFEGLMKDAESKNKPPAKISDEAGKKGN